MSAPPRRPRKKTSSTQVGESLVRFLVAGSQLPERELVSFVSYPLAKQALLICFDETVSKPLREASLTWARAWANKTTLQDLLKLQDEVAPGQPSTAKTIRNFFAHVSDTPKLKTLALTQAAKAALVAEIEHLAGTLPSEEVIDAATRVASRHPNLANRRPYLRSFLQWEADSASLLRELPGISPRLVDAAERSRALQAQIATEAAYAIWEEDVFASDQAALALGAKASNRQRVSALRKSSALLGVPQGNKYLYPSFQFDLGKQAVFNEVREVNTLLDAANDPWGVASWWLSPNGRLGTRPIDAVGTQSTGALVAAARSLTEPLG